MTTRNLNRTWRDVIFAQYEADHEADVPFPIRYLINAPEWKQDIFIEIPSKVDPKTLRNAVLLFYRDSLRGSPEYVGEHISVRPRKRTATTSDQDQDQDQQQDVPL